MTRIAPRVVYEATLVKPAEQTTLRTHALRVCQVCGRVMGKPRSEAEYEENVDVCGKDCWLRYKRGG